MNDQDQNQETTEQEEFKADPAADAMYAEAGRYLLALRNSAADKGAEAETLKQIDRAVAENARFRREDAMLTDFLAEAMEELGDEEIPPIVDEDGGPTEWTVVSWAEELRGRRRQDVMSILASMHGGGHQCGGCGGCEDQG